MPPDDGLADAGHLLGCVGVPVRLAPVQPLGLHEDDRVVGGDGGAQQPVGVGDGGRGDDVQTGRGHVVGLGGVAVVLHAADAAAVGDAHGDRHGQRAAGAVAHLRDVRDELLERRVGERVELHLHDRPQPVHGHADRACRGCRPRRAGCRCSGRRRTPWRGRPSRGRRRRCVPTSSPITWTAGVLGHRVPQRAVQRLRHRGGLAGRPARRRPGPSPPCSSRLSLGLSASSSARSCSACARSWPVFSSYTCAKRSIGSQLRVPAEPRRACRPPAPLPRRPPCSRPRRRAGLARAAPAPAAAPGRVPARPRPRRLPGSGSASSALVCASMR